MSITKLQRHDEDAYVDLDRDWHNDAERRVADGEEDSGHELGSEV